MITKVEIENFQSHKKSVLEFVPGTNVIIGKSDAGKSAVFRAINWVASNRPLGDSFRSEWGGDTRVALSTSEGDVVERIRSATKNEYIINGKALKAFGHDVPEEVVQVLKLEPANIQAQMDSPFLLAISPGEAARQLNKAASIDDIDKTISGLKKTQTDVSRNLKHEQDKLESLQEQIKQYDNIEELEKKVVEVEELNQAYTRKLESLQNLERVIINVSNMEEELQESAIVPELLNKIKGIEQDYIQYQEKQRQLKALNDLLSQIEVVQMEMKKVTITITTLEKDYQRLAPEMCPLCGNKMNSSVGKKSSNIHMKETWSGDI